MPITILYFSTAAACTGLSEETLATSEPLDVAALWAILLERHPSLEAMRPHCRIACNRALVADESAMIHSGDEIAVMPPFSGG